MIAGAQGVPKIGRPSRFMLSYKVRAAHRKVRKRSFSKKLRWDERRFGWLIRLCEASSTMSARLALMLASGTDIPAERCSASALL